MLNHISIENINPTLLSSLYSLNFSNFPMYIIDGNNPNDKYIIIQSVNYSDNEYLYKYIYNDILLYYKKISQDDNLVLIYPYIKTLARQDGDIFYQQWWYWDDAGEYRQYEIQMHGQIYDVVESSHHTSQMYYKLTNGFYNESSNERMFPDIKFISLSYDVLDNANFHEGQNFRIYNLNKTFNFLEYGNYDDKKSYIYYNLTKKVSEYVYNFIIILKYNTNTNKFEYYTHISNYDINDNYNSNRLLKYYDTTDLFWDGTNLKGLSILGNVDSTIVKDSFLQNIKTDNVVKYNNISITKSQISDAKKIIFEEEHYCKVEDVTGSVSQYSFDNIKNNIENLFPVFVEKNIDGNNTRYNILYNIEHNTNMSLYNSSPYILQETITKDEFDNVTYDYIPLRNIQFLYKFNNNYIVGVYSDDYKLNVYRCDIYINDNNLIFKYIEKLTNSSIDIRSNLVYYNKNNDILLYSLYYTFGIVSNYKLNNDILLDQYFPIKSCRTQSRFDDYGNEDIIVGHGMTSYDGISSGNGVYDQGENVTNIDISRKKLVIYMKIHMDSFGYDGDILRLQGPTNERFLTLQLDGDNLFLRNQKGEDRQLYQDLNYNSYICLFISDSDITLYYATYDGDEDSNYSIYKFSLNNIFGVNYTNILRWSFAHNYAVISHIALFDNFNDYDKYTLPYKCREKTFYDYYRNNINIQLFDTYNYSNVIDSVNVESIPISNQIIYNNYYINNTFVGAYNKCNQYVTKIENSSYITTNQNNIIPVDNTTDVVEFSSMLITDGTQNSSYDNLYDYRKLTYNRLKNTNDIFIKEIRFSDRYFNSHDGNELPLTFKFDIDLNDFIDIITDNKFIEFDSTNITYYLTLNGNVIDTIPNNKNDILNIIDSHLSKNKININQTVDNKRYQKDSLIYPDCNTTDEYLTLIYDDGTNLYQKRNLILKNKYFNKIEFLSIDNINDYNIALPTKHYESSGNLVDINYNIYKTNNNNITLNIVIDNTSIDDYIVIEKGRYRIQNIKYHLEDISNITTYNSNIYEVNDTTDIILSYNAENNCQISADTTSFSINSDFTDVTNYSIGNFGIRNININNNNFIFTYTLNNDDYNNIEYNVFNNINNFAVVSFVYLVNGVYYTTNINLYNKSIVTHKGIPNLFTVVPYGYFYDIFTYIYDVNYIEHDSYVGDKVFHYNMKYPFVNDGYISDLYLTYNIKNITKTFKQKEVVNYLNYLGLYGNILDVSTSSHDRFPTITNNFEIIDLTSCFDDATNFYYLYDCDFTSYDNDYTNCTIVKVDGTNIFSVDIKKYCDFNQLNNVYDNFINCVTYNDKIKETPELCDSYSDFTNALVNRQYTITLPFIDGDYIINDSVSYDNFINNKNVYLGLYSGFDTFNSIDNIIHFSSNEFSTTTINNNINGNINQLTYNIFDDIADIKLTYENLLLFNRELDTTELSYLKAHYDDILDIIRNNVCFNINYKQGFALNHYVYDIYNIFIYSGNTVIFNVEKDIYNNNVSILINDTPVLNIDITNGVPVNVLVERINVVGNINYSITFKSFKYNNSGNIRFIDSNNYIYDSQHQIV